MSMLFSQIDKQTNGNYLNEGMTTGLGSLDHNYQLGFLMESMVELAIRDPNLIVGSKVQKTPRAFVLVVEDDFTISLVQTHLSQIIANRTGVNAINTIEFVNGWFAGRGFNLYVIAKEPNVHNTAEEFYQSIVERLGGDNIRLLAVDDPSNFVECTHHQHHRNLVRTMRHRICDTHNGHYLFTHAFNEDAAELRLTLPTAEDFLTKVTGKGYHKGCRVLDQEMDIELNIVMEVGRILLQRGKCRSYTPVPQRATMTATLDNGLVEHA